jgi:hypothetical protein
VPYSALYYPHTSTKDVDLLKTALFLWDRLDFIVPHKTHRLHSDDRYTHKRRWSSLATPSSPQTAMSRQLMTR